MPDTHAANRCDVRVPLRAVVLKPQAILVKLTRVE